MQEDPQTDQRINYIKVKSQLDWDEYFMLQAMLASFKSKDPNTKVGCVFVDKQNHQITMGYNGAIAGIDEQKIPWGNNRTVDPEYQKYGYVMHSEANAISHSTGDLSGSRVYVTLFPCDDCAKLIATQRVREIIFLSDKYCNTSENRIAKRLFDLADIQYRRLTLSQQLIDQLQQYLQGMLKII